MYLEGSENLTQAINYIFKVLEAGEKYYHPGENNKGVINLTEDMTEFLVNDLIGKPVTIDHITLTDSNIDYNVNNIVGRVKRAFINKNGFKIKVNEEEVSEIKADNHAYIECLIDKKTGVELIEKGYLPSIGYTIIKDRTLGKGKVEIEEAQSNHVGLVKFPKFDTAIYQGDAKENFIRNSAGVKSLYYFDNKNNNNNFNIMSQNASKIHEQAENPEVQNQEAEGTSLRDILIDGSNNNMYQDVYIKGNEGDYNLLEVMEAVKEDFAKEYYEANEVIIKGKKVNVRDLIKAYEEKMLNQGVVEVETEVVENEAPKEEEMVKNEAPKEEEKKDQVWNSSKGGIMKNSVNAITKAFKGLTGNGNLPEYTSYTISSRYKKSNNN